MLLEALVTCSLLMSPVTTQAPVITDAFFVDETTHVDLSYLKTTPVAIMGDSISTFAGRSIEGGSDAVYPDTYVTDLSQMWWALLDVQAISAVSGSYVTQREDGEYVNFNSDTRVGALGDTSTVIIYGGTCDLLANVSPDSFRSGLTSLVSNVQYGGMRSTILCTLPPIDYTTDSGATYKDYNKVIKEVAESTNSVVCDFSKVWKKSEISTYTEDGIHPNVAGMSRLAAVFD